ncbi:putative zinc-binding metallopeptidase [Capnocytophaga canimorsus]|nr:putative zinc-binding metallopeptidase [Capnocytophaga canimorsus]CEN46330.1 conserved exported hypothetical protein [Capnocytophaga canimorsus]
MKKFSFYTRLFAILLVVVSCTTEDKPNSAQSVVDFEKKKDTPFDRYIKREFTDVYNIEILYRMPDIQTNQNEVVVPANYANSVKMANLLKYLCLEPYNEVAPPSFLKKYFPKTIMFIGSSAYRNNGTRVLGTAESGVKINLYDINALDPSNVDRLFDFYFRTIFHEFSHIMHQTIDYTKEFEVISATDYVGDSWSNSDLTEQMALDKGFVSRYSRKEANEDFVEILAYYVTTSEASWNAMLSTAGGADKIKQKTAIVKSYMLNTWQIDLDVLRQKVQDRIANLDNVDLDNIN